MIPNVGRPKVASRSLIEDAAADLFLEQGYGRTTVEQIAQRAGVSRATFFNYFEAKSDLLWLDVDAAIARLRGTPGRGIPALRRALLAEAQTLSPPLALTQHELLAAADEVAQSGLVRVAALASVLTAFLDGDRLAGNAVAGAVAAGVVDWARSGVTRGALARRVEADLDRLAAGLG